MLGKKKRSKKEVNSEFVFVHQNSHKMNGEKKSDKNRAKLENKDQSSSFIRVEPKPTKTLFNGVVPILILLSAPTLGPPFATAKEALAALTPLRLLKYSLCLTFFLALINTSPPLETLLPLFFTTLKEILSEPMLDLALPPCALPRTPCTAGEVGSLLRLLGGDLRIDGAEEVCEDGPDAAARWAPNFAMTRVRETRGLRAARDWGLGGTGLILAPIRTLAATPSDVFLLGVGTVVGLPRSPRGLLKIFEGCDDLGDFRGVLRIDCNVLGEVILANELAVGAINLEDPAGRLGTTGEMILFEPTLLLLTFLVWSKPPEALRGTTEFFLEAMPVLDCPQDVAR